MSCLRPSPDDSDEFRRSAGLCRPIAYALENRVFGAVVFRQLLMMAHAGTGITALLAATWLCADAFSPWAEGGRRMRTASLLLTLALWLTFLLGGHWYVAYYADERALITAGPWPAAHTFFMETKEHVFITLLLLSTWLTLAVLRLRPPVEMETLRAVRWSAGMLVVGILAMEGAGALVAMGVKLALLAT